MTFFLKRDYRSFYYLNATQFLGALNDNTFKLLIIYLLINLKGEQAATSILAIAGAIFVIPFLLFSSTAGILADRISKRTIIVSMKFVETIIMSFSILAIYLRSAIGVYVLLFLMASQSAIFGPSKFGIIPEIVDTKNVSKANGIITSFTFLAIIIGTFLASFITDITNKNFPLASFLCLIIAISGLFASFQINKTTPKGSRKKIHPFFLYEIYKTLKLTYKRENLLPAIFGSAYFLFIGGFVQLNTIPFAMQSLHLSEVGGGYLFLSTAIGIAIGSPLAGKLSKEGVVPGLSCIAGYMLSLLLVLLWLFSKFLLPSITIMILLGIFGGMFLIPLDSFIQIKSPEKRRGQVIAASSFLSFTGVLLAAFVLYLISEVFGFTSASGFAIMGISTFCFTLIITGKMANLFLPYFSQKLLSLFLPIKVSSYPSIFILEKRSWLDPLLLFSTIPNLHIITIGKKFKNFPFFNGFFNNIFLATSPHSLSLFLKRLEKKGNIICLFLKKEEIKEKKPLAIFTSQLTQKNILTISFKQKGYLVSFKEENLKTRK